MFLLIASYRYTRQQLTYENAEIDAGLFGHVHLNKVFFIYMNMINSIT